MHPLRGKGLAKAGRVVGARRSEKAYLGSGDERKQEAKAVRGSRVIAL